MSRPTKTFLIEAGALHFRVDLTRNAGAYSVSDVFREESSAGSGPEGLDAFDPMGEPLDASWIAPLLKQRPKPAAEVTILSDKISTVVAELPVGPGEDWQASAEMEVQTISGLSSSEAVVSSTRLPAESGMVCSWVVQAAMRDVAAMRTAVASVSGSRLVAVGHPAGVRLDRVAPQVESWAEFALFHAPGGEKISLRGWNGPDALNDAMEDGEVSSALLESGEEGRLLLADPGPPPLGADSKTIVAFSSPEGTEVWSNALAQACDPLTGQILGLPLVSVPKPPPTTKTLALTATVIAVGTVLLLGAHFLLNRLIEANLNANLATLKEPADKVAASRQRIKQLETELRELEAKSKEVGDDVNVYAHRRRIGALLDGIAAGAGVDNAVVIEFRPDKLDTVVTGAATTFNAPQNLASRIDEALAPNGWRAALVRRTAKLLRADGGPWSYEIRLNPGRPVEVEPPTLPSDEGATAAASPSESPAENGETAVAF
ncbi:MAG: hypothetical protein AAGC68_02215 [Verrucomicrobiota bacterium]